MSDKSKIIQLTLYLVYRGGQTIWKIAEDNRNLSSEEWEDLLKANPDKFTHVVGEYYNLSNDERLFIDLALRNTLSMKR